MAGQRFVVGNSGSESRQFVADDPICQIRNIDADIIVEVLAMSFHIFGLDDLNEPNAIEIVRYSTAGQSVGFPPRRFEPGGQTDPGLLFDIIDDAGWTVTTPTVSDVLGGAYPFNLSTGWQWPPKGRTTGPIVVPPGSTGGVGFRIVDATSAADNYLVKLVYKRIGG